MDSPPKILDLSGYMFSGKAAASDLIREFDGFDVPNVRSEFDLLRVPGGLADLAAAVDQGWSPVRIDGAIRRFERVMHSMVRSPRGLQRFYREGFRYEETYPGISARIDEFVQRITAAEWDMPWPYAIAEVSASARSVFLRKAKAKLRLGSAWPTIHHRLTDRATFYREARAFLRSTLAPKGHGNTVVTHNALEPFNPQSFFELFDDARCIVVDRDPRDIYVTAVTYSVGFNDQVELYRQISGAYDLELFIKRFQILRDNTNYTRHPRVHRIRFEDLVLDYDHAVAGICDFLEIDRSTHSRRGASFDPARSAKNVGLWRSHPDQQSVQRIREALPEFCRE